MLSHEKQGCWRLKEASGLRTEHGWLQVVWYAVSVHDELLAGYRGVHSSRLSNTYDSEWNMCMCSATLRFSHLECVIATAVDDCNRYGCLGNREHSKTTIEIWEVRPSTANYSKHKLWVLNYHSKLFRAQEPQYMWSSQVVCAAACLH